ncbi:hypothetical protein PtrSN002B_009279 [Pyrenophora tritici-repentis]|uniref:Uncharacterized protein n=1 Tax=Pyrenophora tritici-repentis TaxID=45151 RepID=A0A2W1CX05_9PLEO|nr:hypothetical protein PtrV1_02180 [Pyrenophora tritici-repentis]KAF7454924.1 hypothetical protein A1F99_021820 [Pyrenophora tritici-repentis]KAF7578071.1 hypothetical protein PtrM4_023110 [Pyrenophora tritici-repentis]KAG9388682.1 hypothetical protein A1F94_001575 [Pyrenophora tritici-repentis]KAI0584481.1 hypothetical protein Alg215_03057 [Pyrenophora tritici-repentis]
MESLAFSLTQLSVRPKHKHLFLNLPGEIRNAIYAYIAVSFSQEIDVDKARTHSIRAIGNTLNTEQPCLHCIPIANCFPGITFANKQVYAELVPILVANTRFILQSDADADILNWFLEYSKTRKCVKSLAFPQITRPVQNSSFVQPSLFQTCRNLRELSITVDSDAVMPFFEEPPTGTTDGYPNGKVTVMWQWGLPTLKRLSKLKKFMMRCEIRPGQAVTYDAFEDIAHWINLHFCSDVVLLENGKPEERAVRQQHVNFTGATGHIELAVWSWTIVRK